MKLFLYVILLMMLGANLSAQGTLEWVYFDAGANAGSCASQTDCTNDILCYAVTYTPPVTGTMTSYTLSYSGDCVANTINFTNIASCTMADNSLYQDACADFGKFRLFTSGNLGNVPITANTPVILHQVCIDLTGLGSLQVNEDEFTSEPYSVSIIIPGEPGITDTPTFGGAALTTADCSAVVSCNDAPVCSVDFGTAAGQLVFTPNANGNLNDGTSVADADVRTTSFDLYNEVTEDCTQGGGVDDITVATRLVNTFDVNYNGILDPLGGVLHQISQEVDGLSGRIPLGATVQSETSAGDVRGYEIRVEFANHIGIRANQISVNLNGINSPGAAFESAKLTFLGDGNLPYTDPAYLGYYNGTNDLSGTCQFTNAAPLAWTSPAPGGVVFAASSTVNVASPCNPTMGSGGTSGNVSVAAVANAGLAPDAVIRGFVLRVYGEDVAAPNLRDDGIGLNGDDNIRANRPTTTNAQMVSSLLGYDITGCVFEPIALPVTWLEFTARKRGEFSQLEWGTAEETDHDRFTVEWSSDGRSYRTLGTVRTASYENGRGERHYDFNHTEPAPGLNYYRIRQHDYDGSSSLSEVRLVEFGARGSKMEVFPNPATTEVVLRLGSLAAKDGVNGELFAADGRLVKSFRIPVGTELQQLYVGELPPGLYLLKVGTLVERIVKR